MYNLSLFYIVLYHDLRMMWRGWLTPSNITHTLRSQSCQIRTASRKLIYKYV